jgi:putative FmdB family regulatory protein
MPTYEYECKKCANRFEVFQKFSENPISVCPKCKGEVKRLIGGGLGVIFKGSGFYSTDNKKDGKKSSSNGSSSVKPKTEGKEPEVAKAS